MNDWIQKTFLFPSTIIKRLHSDGFCSVKISHPNKISFNSFKEQFDDLKKIAPGKWKTMGKSFRGILDKVVCVNQSQGVTATKYSLCEKKFERVMDQFFNTITKRDATLSEINLRNSRVQKPYYSQHQFQKLNNLLLTLDSLDKKVRVFIHEYKTFINEFQSMNKREIYSIQGINNANFQRLIKFGKILDQGINKRLKQSGGRRPRSGRDINKESRQNNTLIRAYHRVIWNDFKLHGVDRFELRIPKDKIKCAQYVVDRFSQPNPNDVKINSKNTRKFISDFFKLPENIT